MKIKIEKSDTGHGHGHDKNIREIFVLILFCAILALGAFAWGRVYEFNRHENLQEKVYNLETKVKDQNGRITSFEGRPIKK